MNPAIIVTTLLNIFATSPDLCSEVYLDSDGSPLVDSIGQTVARYCEWTGPDAPVLDADVCCEIDGAAACWLPDRDGYCSVGSLWHCMYGEVDASQGVVCYQPFASACDHGHCVELPELPPPTQADLLCCSPGTCQEIAPAQMWDCDDNGGTLWYCQDGMSNADGSVTCFD